MGTPEEIRQIADTCLDQQEVERIPIEEELVVPKEVLTKLLAEERRERRIDRVFLCIALIGAITGTLAIIMKVAQLLL